MDSVALNTFAAVAKRGSVSAAAEDLHTVQSNVTTRIKQLEADLGVTLFVRHSRGVVVTPAGERLMAYTQRFSALAEEMRSALREDGAVQGNLRLGSMETTAAVRLPGLLKTFRSAHPDVHLEVRTGTTVELLDQILSHRLDGAFVAGPVDHPEIEAVPAFDEELLLVSAKSAPPIKEQLAQRRLTVIVFRQGCSYRQRMETAFSSLGWLPFQRLEFGTIDGMLGCVAADVGVCVLPRSVVEKHASRRDLRWETIGRRGLTVQTLFARRADSQRGPVMTAFENTLEAVA